MMTVSLCLSAQTVNDYISEKTKDVAYSAPNTMLVNKKWFVFNGNFEITGIYYIFRANKTGERVLQERYTDCSFERVLPFTWSRDHNNLTLSWNYKNMTYRKLVYTDPSASERKKAEIKSYVENRIKKFKNDVRGMDSYIYKYYINRLDAKLLLLKGLESEIKGLGESKTDRLEDLFLCSDAGKKEIENKK